MRFATRSTLLAVAVALACAATAHAQDAQKPFNAKGASEAQACTLTVRASEVQREEEEER